MNKFRQCISCRVQLSRDNFIRIMKIEDTNSSMNKIVLNPTRHQFGRSTYLCKTASCLTTAIKEKKIIKMLRVSSKALDEIMSELENLISRLAKNVQREVLLKI